MQLTVRDVSKFLQVSDSTVTRWIKQRGLPTHQVGGRFHFNRVELLEWATANRLKVCVEAFDQLAAEDDPSSSLVEALETGGIFHHMKDSTKERTLRALVDVLPLPESVDRELLLRLFLAREASASTAIGDGIALPHVRNPIVLHVARPMVTVCFLDHPVDFGALDGKAVHTLSPSSAPRCEAICRFCRGCLTHYTMRNSRRSCCGRASATRFCRRRAGSRQPLPRGTAAFEGEPLDGRQG